MFCASCWEPTDGDPCIHCGAAPLLQGRYRLEALVAEGQAGVTWRAVRLDDGATTAVKELPLRRARTAKDRELIDREAAILRQLEHRGIPRFHETFTTGSGRNRSVWIVEDFVEGTTLTAHTALHRYDEAEVLGVLDEVLEILEYLHGLSPPVIHRDIKPDNVMRTTEGRHVLVDFGAVRDALRDPDLGGSTVAGTFGYMAPEQFRGDASPATDLYGLGALAVYLLTRTDPHQLQDYHQRMVWADKAHASHGTRSLISAMVEPDPTKRPLSATAARHAVHNLRFPVLRQIRPDAWGAGMFRQPLRTAPPLAPLPTAPLPRPPLVETPPRPRETLRGLLESVEELRETRLQTAGDGFRTARTRGGRMPRGIPLVAASFAFSVLLTALGGVAMLSLVDDAPTSKDRRIAEAITAKVPPPAALPPLPPPVERTELPSSARTRLGPDRVLAESPRSMTYNQIPDLMTIYQHDPHIQRCFPDGAPRWGEDTRSITIWHRFLPDGSIEREIRGTVDDVSRCVLFEATSLPLPRMTLDGPRELSVYLRPTAEHDPTDR